MYAIGYGVRAFACALNKDAVEKLYEIKGRDEAKPFIILLSDKEQLERFGVKNISERAEDFMQRYTPGPVTFILEVGVDLRYLTRGGNTLAFRILHERDLKKIIEHVGPLVAPSANPQGLKTAEHIAEAQHYFGDTVDLYVDGGEITGEPSTIVDLSHGEPKILRQGRIKLDI